MLSILLFGKELNPIKNKFSHLSNIELLVCRYFDFGPVQDFGFFGYKELTLYHTIPTFINPERDGFQKHCRKRRKCWQLATSPFHTMFSTLHKTSFNFSFKSIIPFTNQV